MKSEVMCITVEAWVAKEIESWLTDQIPGSITLHSDGAAVRMIERTDKKRGPKET